MADTKTLGRNENKSEYCFESNSVLTYKVKDRVQRGWKEFRRDTKRRQKFV